MVLPMVWWVRGGGWRGGVMWRDDVVGYGGAGEVGCGKSRCGMADLWWGAVLRVVWDGLGGIMWCGEMGRGKTR